MTKLDELPVEILFQIFSYLPSYGRVSLVNKHFYNVASSVNDSKICAKFYLNPFRLERPEHQSMMDSIQKTTRKISKVSIMLSAGVRKSVEGDVEDDRQKDFYKLAISGVVKILKRFSATIKFFRLEGPRNGLMTRFKVFRINMPDFLEMLSFIPNTEHLELDYVFAQTLSQTKGQVNHSCLKLNQLKTLEICTCDKEFLVVFYGLPTGVLKEFNFSYFEVDFDALAGFFTKQANIKKLTFNDVDEYSERTLPHHIFDNLKLDSLQCSLHEFAGGFAHILSKQTQVKSLELCGVYSPKVDESVLDVITNQLTELVTLELAFDDTLVESFKRITKLKKLKELTINSCSLKTIEAFAESDHSQITTLNMMEIDTRSESDIDNDEYPDPPMPINVISALANSVPNLKSLQFDYHCECPAIIAIMEHFNFVEVLEFSFSFGSDFDAERLRETIDVEKSYNPKLSALTMSGYFTWDGSILTKLIAMYPNLKHLDIFSLREPTTMSSNFELVLSGFKKMNSLYLHLQEWNLTSEHLDCIINRKSNLKWMSLGHLKDVTDEHRRKLGAAFDSVKYYCNILTITN